MSIGLTLVLLVTSSMVLYMVASITKGKGKLGLADAFIIICAMMYVARLADPFIDLCMESMNLDKGYGLAIEIFLVGSLILLILDKDSTMDTARIALFWSVPPVLMFILIALVLANVDITYTATLK